MFERISPESAGISSQAVLGFIKTLEKYRLNTHSIIMARGNNIFCEAYYAPFNRDFKHRMYSVSKSFVSVAVGLLAQDGLISLDDKFIKYFPEYTDESKCSPYLAEMTIRDALKMETCNNSQIDWFHSGTDDRTKLYFDYNPDYIPGSFFRYDSPVSYMLGVIVENITGKPFLELLKERFLSDAGFSSDAYCLKCPGGHSFGDSGVMCTSRDLLTMARFVLNGGTWNGKRYMNEDYLLEATRAQCANSLYDIYSYDSLGYGYQIWCAPDGGFAFVGMGQQLALCDRRHDFIFVINSDDQGNAYARTIIYHALYENIIAALGEPLPEDKKAYDDLCKYECSRVLNSCSGEKHSMFAEQLSGSEYILERNPMGIEKFRFDLGADGGTLYYKNAQGDKKLKFGFCRNEFQKFPQKGYSDIVCGVPAPENMYDCAVSAGWLEPQKLRIKVQAIDKYFGILNMAFSFKDKRVVVKAEKTAEAFFDEYQGVAVGVKAQNKQ